jgi:hypothetical protein
MSKVSMLENPLIQSMRSRSGRGLAGPIPPPPLLAVGGRARGDRHHTPHTHTRKSLMHKLNRLIQNQMVHCLERQCAPTAPRHWPPAFPRGNGFFGLLFLWGRTFARG